MKRLTRFLFIVFFAICYNSSDAQKTDGFVKLFDGKTLDGWQIIGKSGDFKAVDGVIEGISKIGAGNNFLITKKQYGDFVLELDVKVNGAEINSGIQVRSFLGHAPDGGKLLVTGKQCEIDPTGRKWTGGIYDSNRRLWLYPLDLDAKAKTAFKSGVYNHIKIECIGNEMKTWVNGVAAAYLVDTVDKTGFIGLQVHGKDNPANVGKSVYFKNIRIKTTGLAPAPFPKGIYVVNLQPNSLNGYEKRDGWKLLFDGNTAEGWRSATGPFFPKKGWIIGNGMMTVDPQKKGEPGGGDIVTIGKYRAFDLSFEFRTTPAANSGVKYFVYVDEKNGPLGLEYQVLDDKLNPDAKLGRDGDRTESSLYDLIPAKKPTMIIKPVGEWNTGRIVVYPNNHVEHYLNGVKVLEYDRLSLQFKALIAISKYKNYQGFGIRPDGYILLQDHGCVVSFRSIKMKTL